MLKRNQIYLLVLFLLVFGIQIYFSAQTSYYSSDKGYFNFRYIESVIDTGKPVFYDTLSYKGREIFLPPLVYFILALLDLILPSFIVYKVIPSLALSSTVWIVYLLAKNLTKNDKACLIASFMSGFIPIIYLKTLNQISIYCFAIPLIFAILYLFTKLKNYQEHFIIISLILAFVHPSIIILTITFIIYLIISYSEDRTIARLEKDYILLLSLLSLLSLLIFFRQGFFNLGINLIWQNIPSSILVNYFKEIPLIEMVYSAGLIPLFLGVSGILFGLRGNKKETIYLMGSFIIIIFILLFLKLIPFITGLIFLGICTSITSAISIDAFSKYLNKTKLGDHKEIVLGLLTIILIATMIIPTLVTAQKVINDAPNQDQLAAYKWIKENTPENAVILTDITEANKLSALTNRKHFIDSNFIYTKDIEEKYGDLNKIYSTNVETKALELLSKYKIKYILLTEDTQEKYGIKRLKYGDDDICFIENEFGQVKVYEIICK